MKPGGTGAVDDCGRALAADGELPAEDERFHAVITPPARHSRAHTFSQGVRRGGFVQVSGQGPIAPETNEYLFPGDVAAQTLRTLENVKAIGEASGATFDDVVMLRVYLTTRDDFAAMNDAYGAFVTANTPSGVLSSRTTVIVELPREEMAD